MERYFKYCLAVLGAVMLFLPGALAQTIPDSTDQHFLTRAVNSNQFEIALGTQALTQSENEEVNQFGQMLIDEHTAILEELQEVARAKKLVLPSSMEEVQATMLKSLSVLSGTDFDKAFKEAAITTHGNAIELYEHAGDTLIDPEFRSWAAQKVSSFKDHLEKAKSLQIAAE